MRSMLAAAIDDNARWCDRVCVMAGIVTRFDGDAWLASTRSPDFYPDAVTLVDDVDPEGLLARIDRSAGSSVKDSFATLDLAPAGFDVLFTATWIHRAPGSATATAPTGWSRVATAADLRVWADLHGVGATLRPPILDDPSVVVLARRGARGEIDGGAIATVAADAVGISNAFEIDDGGGPTDAERGAGILGEAAAAIAAHAPGLPIVGYVSDDEMPDARAAGFEGIGPLRVWLRPGA